MTIEWPRVMPALVTAMDNAGEIDLDAHISNVGVAVDAGAGGVLIGGSTGEGPYLENGERSKLVTATRDAFGDLTIVAGVFAQSIRQAERQICEIADAEADALLVVTPTALVRGHREWVVDYYETVADTSPLPVFLYTVPNVTGYELPCESVAELAGHHNIIGMKDSGGDTTRLDAISRIMDDSFIVYAGNSRVLSQSVARGAYGAITASANYAFATVTSAVAGDTDAQDRLAAMVTVIEPRGVPGTKYAASLTGMTPGPARKPLRALDDVAKAEIQEAVNRKS
ncbi:MAG: dihydrodipicolinate synthase family protein [Actinomycetia bacterium]|nr:dihydrodipicolinate synthase family protein [Actinomycetes bacterium]